MDDWKKLISAFDDRRDIIILKNAEEAIQFSAQQFIQIGQEAIEKQDCFAVALSGGNTPLAMYKELSQLPYRNALDWSKVLCFWSDERNVPSDHPESNYLTAMQAGLSSLPLKPENIFRMIAENSIEDNAQAYENLIKEKIPSGQFDLMMLGVGEDGHIASLFPHTDALHTINRFVIANHVPQKKTWRMTVTFECIHNAKNISIYALGANKAAIIARVLEGHYNPDQFPAQCIGTPTHKSLWILDSLSADKLLKKTG